MHAIRFFVAAAALACIPLPAVAQQAFTIYTGVPSSALTGAIPSAWLGSSGTTAAAGNDARIANAVSRNPTSGAIVLPAGTNLVAQSGQTFDLSGATIILPAKYPAEDGAGNLSIPGAFADGAGDTMGAGAIGLKNGGGSTYATFAYDGDLGVAVTDALGNSVAIDSDNYGLQVNNMPLSINGPGIYDESYGWVYSSGTLTIPGSSSLDNGLITTDGGGDMYLQTLTAGGGVAGLNGSGLWGDASYTTTQTLPPADNSTSLANTAWVSGQIYNWAYQEAWSDALSYAALLKTNGGTDIIANGQINNLARFATELYTATGQRTDFVTYRSGQNMGTGTTIYSWLGQAGTLNGSLAWSAQGLAVSDVAGTHVSFAGITVSGGQSASVMAVAAINGINTGAIPWGFGLSPFGTNSFALGTYGLSGPVVALLYDSGNSTQYTGAAPIATSAYVFSGAVLNRTTNQFLSRVNGSASSVGIAAGTFSAASDLWAPGDVYSWCWSGTMGLMIYVIGSPLTDAQMQAVRSAIQAAYPDFSLP